MKIVELNQDMLRVLTEPDAPDSYSRLFVALIGALSADGFHHALDPKVLHYRTGIDTEDARRFLAFLVARGVLEADGPYLYRWSATAVRAGE